MIRLSDRGSNEAWARRAATRVLGNEPFRWELYERVLHDMLQGLGEKKLWLDLGCGETDFTAGQKMDKALGVGVDLQAPLKRSGLFIQADIQALPVRNSSAGAVALRFVVEHVPDPETIWDECRRVLAPGGRLLLITTNRLSPQVFLARILPDGVKRLIVSSLFGVKEQEVFPTFHRWNAPARVRKPPRGFDLECVEYAEALNWHSKPLFLVLLAFAALTRPRFLRPLRSNILALYRRVEDNYEKSE